MIKTGTVNVSFQLWHVVYFDQRTHACPSVCMGENNKKHWKMVPFPSCAREAHVRSMKKNEEKSLLVSNWE